MDYSKLAATYEKLDSTRKRLEMMDFLVELFKETPPGLLDRMVYLMQGKLRPDFEGVELGLAERLAFKALVFTTGLPEKELENQWRTLGDLGLCAEDAMARKKQTTLFSTHLTFERVYDNFLRIAKTGGGGSQDLKIKLVAELLHDASPLESKFILRTVVGKLRLGVAAATILESLAITYASKEDKPRVERAYNISSDLGLVGRTLAEKGLEGLDEIHLEVGIPLRPMLCERLSSIPEIIEKIEGPVAFEYKYDGLRLQAHIGPDGIQLFSRQLENVTAQFPDVIGNLEDAKACKACVVEGECVPVNLETFEMLPFQEISHRRGRKHGVASATKEFPVVFFVFDCLYKDGEDLTEKPYLERREALGKSLSQTDFIRVSEVLVTEDSIEAEKFFDVSLESGCEGIIAKDTGEESRYRAGNRGWQWIKYKRDYKSELADTLDLVVVGAFSGKGRRAGWYGALLMAAYNPVNDVFETVCKLGTGFNDEMLAEMPEKFAPYILEEIPELLKKVTPKTAEFVKHGGKYPVMLHPTLIPDVAFEPVIVMEVEGAEITVSPVHTCARNEIKHHAGLAIRFPRFTGRWRDDKGPTDATTTDEIVKMYKMQLKQVGGD